jgi:hypothetical protein
MLPAQQMCFNLFFIGHHANAHMALPFCGVVGAPHKHHSGGPCPYKGTKMTTNGWYKILLLVLNNSELLPVCSEYSLLRTNKLVWSYAYSVGAERLTTHWKMSCWHIGIFAVAPANFWPVSGLRRPRSSEVPKDGADGALRSVPVATHVSQLTQDTRCTKIAKLQTPREQSLPDVKLSSSDKIDATKGVVVNLLTSGSGPYWLTTGVQH